MSRELFPMIQPDMAEESSPLPMYREVAWDFEKDIPVYENGSPVMVEEAQAVLVWAWQALKTERFRYAVFSWNFGNEIQDLIGQSFSDELKQAEAARYVREALLINPYIEDVDDIQVTFENDNLTIQCKLVTIYGEVNLHAG